MSRGTPETQGTEPQNKPMSRWIVVAGVIVVAVVLVWYLSTTFFGSNEPSPSIPSTALKPALQAFSEKVQDGRIASVAATVPSGGHDVFRAFDGSAGPDSFWEVNSIPVDVEVKLKEPLTLRRYAFEAGEGATRMPMEWTVLGSTDGKTWQKFDNRTVSQTWVPGETRTFDVENPSKAQALRFQFTKGFDPGILRIYEVKLTLQ